MNVFCLFHIASKCTQTYHFGIQKIFLWGGDQPPAPHPTPKYATDWICQTSTKWSSNLTCCGQGHNSPQIHNIQQQAVQHTTIHIKSNKCVSKMLTRHTGTAKPMYSTTTPISRPTFTVTTAIYLLPCVTLTFDLLTSKLIVSRPCPLTTCANLHQISSIIFKISSWQVWLVTDRWTDKLSNRLKTHCLCLSVWPDGAIMRADSFNKTTELAEDNGWTRDMILRKL